MDQPSVVGFIERERRIAENSDDPLDRLRPTGVDHLGERRPIEQLHRIVEESLRRAAVVVNRDRIGVGELRRELHLSSKSIQSIRIGNLWAEKLDRGRPLEHAVLRFVDDAHGAFTELPF